MLCTKVNTGYLWEMGCYIDGFCYSRQPIAAGQEIISLSSIFNFHLLFIQYWKCDAYSDIVCCDAPNPGHDVQTSTNSKLLPGPTLTDTNSL